MLIDAHCHLDLYGPRAARVVAELGRRRVFAVSVALDPASYHATKELAAGSPFVLPAFGIHPWRAADFADRLEDLEPLIEETPLIGEIGLDYHFGPGRATLPAQRRVLDHFLAAAAAQDKVVNLHTKAAEDDVLAALRGSGVRRAIVHWYSGPVRAFVGLVEAGAYFTVGVEVLVSDAIRDIAREIPADRLLTETDNPGGYRWLTGGDGQPRHLDAVLDEVARVRGDDPGALQAAVRANFEELIRGDARLEEPWRRAVAS
jgi:TatD DNase family protein